MKTALLILFKLLAHAAFAALAVWFMLLSEPWAPDEASGAGWVFFGFLITSPFVFLFTFSLIEILLGTAVDKSLRERKENVALKVSFFYLALIAVLCISMYFFHENPFISFYLAMVTGQFVFSYILRVVTMAED